LGEELPTLSKLEFEVIFQNITFSKYLCAWGRVRDAGRGCITGNCPLPFERGDNGGIGALR